MFHVSQLKLSILNSILNHTQPPPPPIKVDGKEEFEVVEILNSKLDCRYKCCPLWYFIWWCGYEGTDEEFSWIAADEIHADELVPTFHQRYPHKPGPLET